VECNVGPGLPTSDPPSLQVPRSFPFFRLRERSSHLPRFPPGSLTFPNLFTPTSCVDKVDRVLLFQFFFALIYLISDLCKVQSRGRRHRCLPPLLTFTLPIFPLLLTSTVFVSLLFPFRPVKGIAEPLGFVAKLKVREGFSLTAWLFSPQRLVVSVSVLVRKSTNARRLCFQESKTPPFPFFSKDLGTRLLTPPVFSLYICFSFWRDKPSSFWRTCNHWIF